VTAKRNALRITCPDETPYFLRVELNGKEIKNLISLKVEVPSGRNTPLLKVRLEFYSSLSADLVCDEILRDKQALRLTHRSVKSKSPSSHTETDSRSAPAGSSRR
jgi:hypothetical protein